jgi:iron(III) transport system ATP-binding protein
MDKGVIVQESSPLEIYQNPVNRFVAGFIGQSNFLDGTIAARDGAGHGTVKTAAGVLKCRVPDGVADGAAVTVAVRPEDIRLADGAAPAGHNVVDATVAAVVFLGESLECQVRLGDTTVKFKAHPTAGIKRDARVKLSLDPDKCRALAG